MVLDYKTFFFSQTRTTKYSELLQSTQPTHTWNTHKYKSREQNHIERQKTWMSFSILRQFLDFPTLPSWHKSLRQILSHSVCSNKATGSIQPITRHWNSMGDPLIWKNSMRKALVAKCNLRIRCRTLLDLSHYYAWLSTLEPWQPERTRSRICLQMFCWNLLLRLRWKELRGKRRHPKIPLLA